MRQFFPTTLGAVEFVRLIRKFFVSSLSMFLRASSSGVGMERVEDSRSCRYVRSGETRSKPQGLLQRVREQLGHVLWPEIR